MRAVLIILAAGTLALAAAPTAAAIEHFQSPSRNVACAMAKTGVRCDIRHRAWRPPPKPASCRLDWGHAMALSRRGRGTFLCAGDTLLGTGGPLPYGRSRTAGRFRCTSRRTGIRCINRRNAHGFFLSRQRFRRF